MFYHPRVAFLLGVSLIAIIEGTFCVIIFVVYSFVKYLTRVDGRVTRALTDETVTDEGDETSSEVSIVPIIWLYCSWKPMSLLVLF